MAFDSHPLISIAMPVYNCERWLARSLRSLVHQTCDDWELLLIDDGSTDRTLEIAQSFPDSRIHLLVDRSHRGLIARLNQAIDRAGGKYLARMDGDDIAYPKRLEMQTRYLDAHPEVDLLGGGILVFKRDGEVLGTREVRTSHQQICRRPWSGFYLPHPTWIGRAGWFRKHRYRPGALRCEDQELLLRTHKESQFAALGEIVLGYREEELSLRKILTGRRSFVRCVLSRAKAAEEYALATAVLADQLFKGTIDCVAIATGLHYRLLRHRALPANAFQRSEWASVWNQVNEFPDTLKRSASQT